jgi:hypothetical protein
MLLEIPCKAGTFQILEEGLVQIQAAERKIWVVPLASIRALKASPGEMLLNLLVYTTQGIYQAERVTAEDGVLVGSEQKVGIGI